MRPVKSSVAVGLGEGQPAADERNQLEKDINALCDRYSDVFADPGMPPARALDHKIELVDEGKRPPKPRQYRLSQVEQAEVRK